jgi:hypothetical protein
MAEHKELLLAPNSDTIFLEKVTSQKCLVDE